MKLFRLFSSTVSIEYTNQWVDSRYDNFFLHRIYNLEPVYVVDRKQYMRANLLKNLLIILNASQSLRLLIE